jgi:hypothetical protein
LSELKKAREVKNIHIATLTRVLDVKEKWSKESIK